MKKIVLLKESKKTIDRRVALTPTQVEFLEKNLSQEVSIKIEESNIRTFKNDEYSYKMLVDDVYNEADYYIGVKEVAINKLIKGKTYIFFSHTIKGQHYNMPLLEECLKKQITLIDYEAIHNEEGKRLIGFGDVAGIVGAYNTFRAYIKYFKNIDIPKASELNEISQLIEIIKKLDLTGLKITVTGKGFVGANACEFLEKVGFKKLSLTDFMQLNQENTENFYCNIDYKNYYTSDIENRKKSTLKSYLKKSDILICGHYYKKGDPVILNKKDFQDLPNLKVVGDLSCDINGPIACTVKPTTIEEPCFFYNKIQNKETDILDDNTVVVMAVDNLPCELPKEASKRFGEKFINNVIPEILKDNSQILKEATICKEGKLTDKYIYLKRYL